MGKQAPARTSPREPEIRHMQVMQRIKSQSQMEHSQESIVAQAYQDIPDYFSQKAGDTPENAPSLQSSYLYMRLWLFIGRR